MRRSAHTTLDTMDDNQAKDKEEFNDQMEQRVALSVHIPEISIPIVSLNDTYIQDTVKNIINQSHINVHKKFKYSESIQDLPCNVVQKWDDSSIITKTIRISCTICNKLCDTYYPYLDSQSWICDHCKICSICYSHDSSEPLFSCDACDSAYHLSCFNENNHNKLQSPSEDENQYWTCCCVCIKCNKNTGHKDQMYFCVICKKIFHDTCSTKNDDGVCSDCQQNCAKCFKKFGKDDFIQCFTCSRKYHPQCITDDITQHCTQSQPQKDTIWSCCYQCTHLRCRRNSSMFFSKGACKQCQSDFLYHADCAKPHLCDYCDDLHYSKPITQFEFDSTNKNQKKLLFIKKQKDNKQKGTTYQKLLQKEEVFSDSDFQETRVIHDTQTNYQHYMNNPFVNAVVKSENTLSWKDIHLDKWMDNNPNKAYKKADFTGFATSSSMNFSAGPRNKELCIKKWNSKIGQRLEAYLLSENKPIDKKKFSWADHNLYTLQNVFLKHPDAYRSRFSHGGQR